MSLTAGIRLGPYEIVAPLGAGGMGEVYRARDTKLHRDVAIKILPEAFALDRERLARFDREAQALAALHHPNIASIFGLDQLPSSTGSGQGAPAIVMELVDGDTLADRIARGALPPSEALDIARQIGDGLDAAHEKGIIHRDLKPANIKITPEGVVKILDFGLAKTAVSDQLIDPANSPTFTSLRQGFGEAGAPTQLGVILGTAAYMSPEQARGKPIDRRADIWALGCVWYEMLTGKSPFAGEDVTEILGGIVKGEPDWSALPAGTPAGVRTLLMRCLRKDVRKRIRSAGDILLDLEDGHLLDTSPAAAPQTPARTRWMVAMAIAGLLVGSVATALVAWRARPTAPQPTGRFIISLPEGQRLAGFEQHALSFSPDGRRLAYVATTGGLPQLYVRDIDRFESKLLPGTEGAANPFFSPDGQWLGFFSEGAMKKIAAAGGPPVTLARSEDYGRGGTWGRDGTIVFAAGFITGLSTVSADGGAVRPLTRPDRAKKETSHRFPHHLPSGDLLFTAGTGGSWDEARIELLKLATGERKVVIEGGSDGWYAPSGHIVFVRSGSLMAVPFDIRRSQVTGPPVALVEMILPSTDNTGAAQAAFTETGTLAYVSGDARVLHRTLVWIDRNGTEQPLSLPPRAYRVLSLSSDATRLLVDIDQGNNANIWMSDLIRGTLALVIPNECSSPIWHPDQKRMLFVSSQSGTDNIFIKAVDGSAIEERLSPSPHSQFTGSFSPDGRIAAFTETDPVSGWDIFTIALDTREKSPYLKTTFNEAGPAFSPDGRWIAYQSDESGRDEVYVRPYPGPGSKELISIDGGIEPQWSRSGRELFYRNGDRMMSVAIATAPAFGAQRPVVLFEKPYWSRRFTHGYDVARDGRFLMIKEHEQVTTAKDVHVVLGWFDEVVKKAPSRP